MYILGLAICFLAGVTGKVYGGWPGLGAIILGEIGVGIMMFSVK